MLEHFYWTQVENYTTQENKWELFDFQLLFEVLALYNC